MKTPSVRNRARLSHVNAAGRVAMVDVGPKPATMRCAVATAVVKVGRAAFAQLAARRVAKGDALATAKLAGIMAAKRTPELIPLCHGLSPEFVDVQVTLVSPDRVEIRAEARVEGKTGVEMEAMVAASMAALTIYDMCKAVEKGIVIGPVRLESKTGGKSGSWKRK